MLRIVNNRTVVSIGNFDGMHVGHQAILRCASEIAKANTAPLVGMTFDPHPATVLRPGSEPPRLMSREKKIQMLHDAGADQVVVLEPTAEFLNKTADQFVSWLAKQYAPSAVVEGPDFRFGKDRGGDIRLLRRLGKREDFEVVQVDRVYVSLSDQLVAPVSSSLVRWLLGHGRVVDAAICLGRSYCLIGPVAKGEQRGRKLGIPTANLDSAVLTDCAVPADGVYAGRVERLDDGSHPAAISIGIKPTFGHRARVVEAHLVDYDGDLYGQSLIMRFDRWLRDQETFPGVHVLKAQLARDVAKVRQLADEHLLDDVPRRSVIAGRAARYQT